MRGTNAYGNIKEINLIDVFETNQYESFKKKVLTIPKKCKYCELYKLCHNGCPVTRIKNGKLSHDGVYVYCNQRKKLFEEIKNNIRGG